MAMETAHIVPLAGERPAQFAERLGREYANASIQKEKKHKGQFFTPLAISAFMGGLATPSKKKEVSILDPGCGLAILSCALIEHLIESGALSKITLTLYETDKKVIPLTEAVMNHLKDWCGAHKVVLEYQLNETDFVLDKCECLDGADTIFGEMFGAEKYDYIISNPPYFKLAKDDVHTRSCASIVDGQTNIYALFMAICAKILSEDGQMIFITPRSFASGRYFRSFRDFLFSQVHIDLIHLFNTRKDTFSKDEVLQELVIMRMHPAGDISNITVSFSQGISDLGAPYQKDYPATDIVDVTSDEKVVFLPVDGRDEAILNLFRSWDGNMEKYGIKISTGPVVAFRAYDFIINEPAEDTVPLYWLHNVVKMLCDHPVQKKDKGQYIRVVPETKAALLPNKNYVLLRRFSSKDDSSRLVAAPYFGNMTKSEFVGIENKLNYIYRPEGHLRRDEVMGLTALLDSEMFDAWFRTFNGNINVSATELRMMPLPPIETIREIGRKIILRNNYSIDYINDLVLDYFKIR
ncbi:MAG: Eco57I restriction-modification methylase domain-containing protein [Bacteroidales bacterium]|jgi:adenine-specific DNA-methyltransferase|nr:Eco57I restriction-modification methylase domain-containing protein [Bacteroidales bacterium]